MAAGYGYVSPRYGGGTRPPRQTRPQSGSLALAASGVRRPASDPFGLLTDTTDSARVARRPPLAGPGAIHPHIAIQSPQVAQGGAQVGPAGQAMNTAPTVQHQTYDINTDPALQQVNALVGMNDEQAQAEALKQKKNLLLDYGDPELARAVLGEDPTVAAAGANPFSTRARLGEEHGRNLRDLTEQLNQANLLYSGHRVVQEGQAAHDYEDALAQAASGANKGLGDIAGNLSGALSANEAQRIQALNDAYGRQSQQAGVGDQDIAALIASLTGGGATDIGAGADSGLAAAAAMGGTDPSGIDPVTGLPRRNRTRDIFA